MWWCGSGGAGDKASSSAISCDLCIKCHNETVISVFTVIFQMSLMENYFLLAALWWSWACKLSCSSYCPIHWNIGLTQRAGEEVPRFWIYLWPKSDHLQRKKKQNIFTRRNVFPGSFHSFILQCQCYCPRDLHCVRRYYIFNKDWHLTCSRRSGDSLNVASNISSSCAGVTFLQQKNLK